MTISTTQIKVVYKPDGAEVRFPVPFPVFDARDIECVAVDADGTEAGISNFAVEGLGSAEGVYVRFAAAPAFGVNLVIRRNTLAVQETAYPEGGKFPSATVERDFDHVTSILQELKDGVDRALQVTADKDEAPTAEEFYQQMQDFNDAAEQFAAEAAASAGEAAGSAVEAAGSVLAAEAIASGVGEQVELARKWAENPEYLPVIPAHYSALHWAGQAQKLGAEQVALAKAQAEEAEYWAGKAQENATGPGGVVLSDALDGGRKAAEGVGASEWALAQVNGKAEEAKTVAEGAKTTADEARETAQNAADALAGIPAITTTGEADKLPKLDEAGRLRLGAAPDDDNDAATKAYVDEQSGGGGTLMPTVDTWVYVDGDGAANNASATVTLPQGGTWAYYIMFTNSGTGNEARDSVAGIAAGGTSFTKNTGMGRTKAAGFAWRIV